MPPPSMATLWCASALLVLALLSAGCTADKGDTKESLACADLLKVPSHTILDVEAVYYLTSRTGSHVFSSTRESGGCGDDMTCPSLVNVPCNNGTDFVPDSFYCDPCGQVWRCGVWEEGFDGRLRSWNYSGFQCECVAEDFTIDRDNPRCSEDY